MLHQNFRRSKFLSLVQGIVTSPVITVNLQATVDECMQRMTNKHYRYLPVVEDEKVFPMLTLGDVVNWIISTQERTIRNLKDYISGNDLLRRTSGLLLYGSR